MHLSQYRNIERPEILQDDSYGIEGKFLVSVRTEGESTLLDQNGNLTAAGAAAIRCWHDISGHFNSVDTHEYLLEENAFHGLLNIDVSGKKVGNKQLFYNIVSQYEIAFGLMVGRKNPFLLEGSVFHVISWFKASSMIEIMKHGSAEFRWSSGYFDFTVANNQFSKDIRDLVSISKNS